MQHPRIGQVILEQAAALKDAVPIILHHHERYAGHGYPYGLRANEIPLGARIVAIADAYDAMIHDRPYKRAMTPRPGDRRAAPPRGHAVRPGARQPVLRPVRGRAPEPDPTVLAMIQRQADAAHESWSCPRARRVGHTRRTTRPKAMPPIRDDVGRQPAAMAGEGIGVRASSAARSAIPPATVDRRRPSAGGGPLPPTAARDRKGATAG